MNNDKLLQYCLEHNLLQKQEDGTALCLNQEKCEHSYSIKDIRYCCLVLAVSEKYNANEFRRVGRG